MASPVTRKSAREVLIGSCYRLGVDPKDICSDSRKQPLTRFRQEIMHDIFVSCPHFSTPEIGRLLGGRDHTTILHGIKSHANLIGSSYEVAVATRMAAAAYQGLAMHGGYQPQFQAARFRGLMEQYAKAMGKAA